MTGNPPPPEPQRGLGTAVRKLRRAAELSQEDLAQAAQIPAPRLALIESGKHDPTWGDMRQVTQALGVSLEALSELAEEHELDREV